MSKELKLLIIIIGLSLTLAILIYPTKNEQTPEISITINKHSIFQRNSGTNLNTVFVPHEQMYMYHRILDLSMYFLIAICNCLELIKV